MLDYGHSSFFGENMVDVQIYIEYQCNFKFFPLFPNFPFCVKNGRLIKSEKIQEFDMLRWLGARVEFEKTF